MKTTGLWQTKRQEKNHFEGYYFKQTNARNEQSVAIIVGVSTFEADPHAFIQIIHNHPHQSYYLRIPLQCFRVQNHPFMIKIQQNIFSEHYIKLQCTHENIHLSGELYFSDLTYLDHYMMNDSIMGPFKLLPKMECNHELISLYHHVHGQLQIGHLIYDFKEDSIGYIEKDYGISFPNYYLWLQGNTFKKEHTSLFFSCANIPYLHMKFPGFICVLMVGKKQYRFATYNKSQLEIDEQMNITLKHGKYKLLITFKNDQTNQLLGPSNGEMNIVIKEGLGATIHIELYEHQTCILNDTCTLGAMEQQHFHRYFEHTQAISHKNNKNKLTMRKKRVE